MKVKWEQRDSMENSRQVCLHAILVDGQTDDSETEIDRLGSIEKRYLSVNIPCTREFHQGLFWLKIDDKLNRLELDEATRKSIEAQIAETVPRPGDGWALWGVTCIPRYD
jgi:hypothetical protein